MHQNGRRFHACKRSIGSVWLDTSSATAKYVGSSVRSIFPPEYSPIILAQFLVHLATYYSKNCASTIHQGLHITPAAHAHMTDCDIHNYKLWLSSPPIQQCNIKLINRFPLKRHRVVHLKRKGNTSLVKCWQACTGPLFYLLHKKARRDNSSHCMRLPIFHHPPLIP